MDARIKSGHDGVEELCRWNREPYRRVLSTNPTGQLDRFLNRERNRPNRIARIGGLGSGRSTSGSPIGPSIREDAQDEEAHDGSRSGARVGLVAFTPDLASAGHGHGGGHGWHGHRGWYGYRGWRGYGWGWGGWWGPGIAISIGGYGRRCWSPSYGYYPCRYRWGY